MERGRQKVQHRQCLTGERHKKKADWSASGNERLRVIRRGEISQRKITEDNNIRL